MAQAITTWEAFGWERDEPLTSRFRQVMVIRTSGLSTDVTYDFDVNAGTFWTAAANANALATIKNIQTIAKCFLHAMGPELETRAKLGGALLVIDATVAAGSATPAVTATGLLTTDVILAVTQNVKGANSLPLLGYNTVIADGYTAVYSADPGANGHLKTTVYRPTGAITPQKGQYVETITNTRPDIVFASGDAPLTATFWLEWDLQPGQRPVVASGTATT